MFVIFICIYSFFALYGIYTITKKHIPFRGYISYDAVCENNIEYDIRTILRQFPECTLNVNTYIKSDIPYILAKDFPNITIFDKYEN